MNIGILLAAGNSSRFGSLKQLYQINGKNIVSHSIDAMSCLDDIIVVTNEACREIVAPTVLFNNTGDRLDSLKIALDYIGKKDIQVIIHDAARPFITQDHIKAMLNPCVYQQYYLRLVNGLAKQTLSGYEVVDRDQYIELCTPQAVESHFLDFAFRTYLDNRTYHEILTVAELLKIKYHLIEGHYQYLRKITTLADIAQERTGQPPSLGVAGS